MTYKPTYEPIMLTYKIKIVFLYVHVKIFRILFPNKISLLKKKKTLIFFAGFRDQSR